MPSPSNDLQQIHEFPDLDSSIVTLLGISNASYLANKAVPHGEPPKPTPT